MGGTGDTDYLVFIDDSLAGDNLAKVNHDRDELRQLGLQLIRKTQGFEVCHPSIVPCRGAQLLAVRSLIYRCERADSKNHVQVP